MINQHKLEWFKQFRQNQKREYEYLILFYQYRKQLEDELDQFMKSHSFLTTDPNKKAN